MCQWSLRLAGVTRNWGVTRKVKAEVRVWGGCSVVWGRVGKRQELVERKEKDDSGERSREDRGSTERETQERKKGEEEEKVEKTTNKE